MFNVGDSVQLYEIPSKKATPIMSSIGTVIETGKLRGKELVKCAFPNHHDEFTKRNDGIYRNVGYSAACCDVIEPIENGEEDDSDS